MASIRASRSWRPSNMVASTMLKGGFSNRTLQYADVSSMTRTCAADSVMIHAPCNEDVHERGSRSDGAWQPLRAAGAGKETKVCLRQPDQVVSILSNTKIARERE